MSEIDTILATIHSSLIFSKWESSISIYRRESWTFWSQKFKIQNKTPQWEGAMWSHAFHV